MAQGRTEGAPAAAVHAGHSGAAATTMQRTRNVAHVPDEADVARDGLEELARAVAVDNAVVAVDGKGQRSVGRGLWRRAEAQDVAPAAGSVSHLRQGAWQG